MSSTARLPGTLTHRDICRIIARKLSQGVLNLNNPAPYEPGRAWLASNHKWPLVLCEFNVIDMSETPDVFASDRAGHTLVVEAKASRSDFLRDRHKPWRQEPCCGMGLYRVFACPPDVIRPDDLTGVLEGWGLTYVEKDYVRTIVAPTPFRERHHAHEIHILTAYAVNANRFNCQVFITPEPTP